MSKTVRHAFFFVCLLGAVANILNLLHVTILTIQISSPNSAQYWDREPVMMPFLWRILLSTVLLPIFIEYALFIRSRKREHDEEHDDPAGCGTVLITWFFSEMALGGWYMSIANPVLLHGYGLSYAYSDSRPGVLAEFIEFLFFLISFLFWLAAPLLIAGIGLFLIAAPLVIGRRFGRLIKTLSGQTKAF